MPWRVPFYTLARLPRTMLPTHHYTCHYLYPLPATTIKHFASNLRSVSVPTTLFWFGHLGWIGWFIISFSALYICCISKTFFVAHATCAFSSAYGFSWRCFLAPAQPLHTTTTRMLPCLPLPPHLASMHTHFSPHHAHMAHTPIFIWDCLFYFAYMFAADFAVWFCVCLHGLHATRCFLYSVLLHWPLVF